MTHLDDYQFEPDLARASTIPARWYRDPEVFEGEKRKVFGRTWQAVGRLDMVSRPGDYFAAEILGEPLAITRDNFVVPERCRPSTTRGDTISSSSISGWRFHTSSKRKCWQR